MSCTYSSVKFEQEHSAIARQQLTVLSKTFYSRSYAPGQYSASEHPKDESVRAMRYRE